MEHIHENSSQELLQQKNKYRDRIELLRNRLGLLTGRDKILMTMYLENGNSFSQIAGLIGVYPSTINRRIERVIRRLTDSAYIICLKNRDKFTKLERQIARDYFLGCVPIKKIAMRRNMTYYQARETIRKIRVLGEVLKRAGKSSLVQDQADGFDGEAL